MANDDEVEVPLIDEDVRMAVLHGDDESDLEADREELFGSAATTIKVGEEDDGAGASATAAGAGDGGAAGVADGAAGATGAPAR
ncbi:unnamed protein product [Urochloa humidicola]